MEDTAAEQRDFQGTPPLIQLVTHWLSCRLGMVPHALARLSAVLLQTTNFNVIRSKPLGQNIPVASTDAASQNHAKCHNA